MTEESITPFLGKNVMNKWKNTPLKQVTFVFQKKKKVLAISFPELMLHTQTKKRKR